MLPFRHYSFDFYNIKYNLNLSEELPELIANILAVIHKTPLSTRD